MMGDYYLYKLPCELLNDSRLLSKLETENETQRTTKSPTKQRPILNYGPHHRRPPPPYTHTQTHTHTHKPDQTDNQSIPDKNDIPGDPMDQPPAATPNHPPQTPFKRPRKATPDSEDHPNNTTLIKEQGNSAIHTCRELHFHSIRDVDKLQNLNTDKKKESSPRPSSLNLRTMTHPVNIQ